jgi:hypothetical protein
LRAFALGLYFCAADSGFALQELQLLVGELLPSRTIFLQQIQATKFTQKPVLCFKSVQPFVAQTQTMIDLFEKWLWDTGFELLDKC